MAGPEVLSLAAHVNRRIIPVDSEHSAVFFLLENRRPEDLDEIILTASGGAFRNKSAQEIAAATVEDALAHPTWDMGAKITIDSSTLVNKGLEVIEASHLFRTPADNIDVVVHRESIVHSLVEFVDSSVIAQLGLPSMKLPISYALNYPSRELTPYESLNLAKLASLHFEEPDIKTFRGLALAYEAIKIGGTMPTVYNMANEIAVGKFLKKEIKYLEIIDTIERAMDKHSSEKVVDIEQILQVESWTRELLK